MFEQKAQRTWRWLLPAHLALVAMPLWVAGFFVLMPFSYHFSFDSIRRAASEMPEEKWYAMMQSESRLLPQQKSSAGRWVDDAAKAAFGIQLSDPRSFLVRGLPGFAIYDSHILIAGEGTNYTTLPIETESLQQVPMPKPPEPDPVPELVQQEKKVLLYFTHTSEAFAPQNGQALHIAEVGTMIQQELEKKGIGTIVDQTDIGAILQEKGKSYSRSYEESRPVVEASMKKTPSLAYFVDIHRDSQKKEVTTATVNGQVMAKTVFVVGGEHARYEENATFAAALHRLFEQHYPGLSRGVIVKSGQSTNGKFNQDLSNRAILIEMGGVDNTKEELARSAAAFADVLARFIGEEQSE